MYEGKNTVTTTTLDPMHDADRCWPLANEPIAPQAAELRVSKPFSFYLRVADTSERWDGVLWSVESTEHEPVCQLSGGMEREQPALIVELWTDYHAEPLRLAAPLAMIGRAGWHDLLVRYTGPNVQFFVDGVLLDEDWPAGNLRGNGSGRCLLGSDGQTAWSGIITGAAWWTRVLSNEEIIYLSGEADAVATRDREILGEEAQHMQYWRPRGYRTSFGDCMPFFHDGRFHLFYLADRHQHQSKWYKGAHQWAHISTTDLRQWDHHPMAVPITEEWEGSICTGSVFYWDGVYYAFYAVRTIDESPAPLQAAESTDGIHFTKTSAQVTLDDTYTASSVRDPVVFRDEETGLFHMLVTTSLQTAPLASHHCGCLAHLVSPDLRQWEQTDPFIVPGLPGEPECADYFYWRGWYYLIFSNHAIARYRMSRHPLGPWQRPKVDTFDGGHCAVMKTAAFTGDRRLGAAFIPDNGYGGNLVLREIIQLPDGTLGTAFPPELLPPTGTALSVSPTPVVGEVNSCAEGCTIQATEGIGAAMIAGMPENVRITMRVTPQPGTGSFGLCVRAKDYADGHELRIEPDREKVGWRSPLSADEEPQYARYLVEGMDQPFTLDLILKDDLFDLCIADRRTLVVRMSAVQHGDRLYLYVTDGDVEFSDIQFRPLCE